jgi:pimeloyl-ACP methyl ester carboxylesterase
MYVQIGGIDQWVQFRDHDPAKPVLLYLHGGPGGTSVPAAAAWKPWEEHFTVVHWDQRGAGRTFAKNRETGCGSLTIDRMVCDGIEVAEFCVQYLELPEDFEIRKA